MSDEITAFAKPGSWEQISKVLDALLNRGGYGIEVDLYVFGKGWSSSTHLWDTACCCLHNGVDWLRHVRIYDPNADAFMCKSIEGREDEDEWEFGEHYPCHSVLTADGDWTWEDDTPEQIDRDLLIEYLGHKADPDKEYKDNVAVWRLFCLFVGVPF